MWILTIFFTIFLTLFFSVNDKEGEKCEIQNFKCSEIKNKIFLPYDKEFSLPYWYIPENLVQINPDFTYGRWNLELVEKASIDLERMFLSAKKENLDLKIISAYRSYDRQKEIKTRNIEKHGKEAADRFSADPGKSEHQLGTAIDISTYSIGYLLNEKFEKTPEFIWLSENSEKYGFKLSYPRGNEFFIFEPWHYRWHKEYNLND